VRAVTARECMGTAKTLARECMGSVAMVAEVNLSH
jgi:hypothetical protein